MKKGTLLYHLSTMAYGLAFTLFLADLSFANSVKANLTVTGGAELKLGSLSMVQFKQVNFASLGPDIQSYGGIQAYSLGNYPILITMTSNTSSDSNGNPQLQFGTNFIPYTVSFVPCTPRGQTPMSAIPLKTTTSATIPTPFSWLSACNSLTGGTPGSLTFTRPTLSSLPPAGTYMNTLTFTVTET